MKDEGIGNGAGSASGAARRNLSHCLREIESAIMLSFVEIYTARNKILYCMHFNTRGRTRDITSFDLEDCLFNIATRA